MDMIIIRGIRMCVSLFLQPDACDRKPWRFVEFYDVACYHYVDGARGGWAGASGERTDQVMKRVADGVAEYQDYLERRHSMRDKKEK